MDEKLKAFLDEKKAEEGKKYQEDKNRLLLELGLYEKVYAPDDQYSYEFPFYEFDYDMNKVRYFNRKVIDITA